MDVIIPSKLKYNSKAIINTFKRNKSRLTVTENIYIVFPTRYINKGFVTISNKVKLLSIFAILDDKGNYATVNRPLMITLTPDAIRDIEIDGSDSKILTFEKGNMMMDKDNFIKQSSFAYKLLEEFFFHGNVPWFLSHEEVTKVYYQADKFAGINLGKEILSFEIITSLIAKDANNKNISFRQSLKTQDDLRNKKCYYAGLMNPFYTYDNTVAKILGSYKKNGILSSIIKPQDSPSRLEEIMTS